MSDTNGNLLFFSDGHKVLNKNHEVIQGGNSGSGFLPGKQSVLSIPKPGSGSIYYVFTARSPEEFNPMFYYIHTFSMEIYNHWGQIVYYSTAGTSLATETKMGMVVLLR